MKTPWIVPVLFTALPLLGYAAENSPQKFQFRLPRAETFQLEPTEPDSSGAQRISAPKQWLRAHRVNATNQIVDFGSRVVVQLTSSNQIKSLLQGRPLTLARSIDSNVFVLQAPDALTAIEQAESLAQMDEVKASYPVLRRSANLHGPYAPPPTDFFYLAEWQLEHRINGMPAGPDLNVRAAWPFTMGQGVTVAVADTGIEMNHQELAASLSNSVHRNFALENTNAAPIDRGAMGAHGTQVAGLIAAGLNNHRIVGVAPEAKLASWVVFAPDGMLASDEQLYDMYTFPEGNVSIQNHSWGGGNGYPEQVGPTLLEMLGIERAASLGRGGLGSVIVRSAGNDRTLPARADDDSYAANPFSIAVAAVNVTGRSASYSEPGACVLVGAPSGDFNTGSTGLFTTDLIGSDGANQILFCHPLFPDCSNKDLSDYNFQNGNAGGFNGTSASAPLISGIAALMLSVNPQLTFRDVQHILALSARHFDLNDPDLKTNGAGFVVSHNVGFGIPDASQAVRLAQTWSNASWLVTLSGGNSQPMAIPDDSLRVEVTGIGIPGSLSSIRCLPGLGVHADDPTALLELVDVGLAGTVPALDLTNKGALILRGDFDFSVKIENAAKAGAAFAVIYNYGTNVNPSQGGDVLTAMSGTDMSPIPAVFIGNSSGEALKSLIQTNTTARARLRLQGVEKTFQINSPLICEYVGVRVQTDHLRRGDLRITLVSPQGTRSVLQSFNLDSSAGPSDWTYWSTHHFHESSAGNWKVCITDEASGATGAVQSVSLILRGTQITDADRDGLDDIWETTHLSSLASGPKDDPDGDGSWNAREQAVRTNPAAPDQPFAIDFNWWDLAGYRRTRLTWPGNGKDRYEILSGTNLSNLTLLTNIPSRFPETEWLELYSTPPNDKFYRVRAVSTPE